MNGVGNSPNTPILVFPHRRLCRNRSEPAHVILNEVKNLDLLIGCKMRDPSAAPQDDIAPQSVEGEENPLCAVKCKINLACRQTSCGKRDHGSHRPTLRQILPQFFILRRVAVLLLELLERFEQLLLAHLQRVGDHTRGLFEAGASITASTAHAREYVKILFARFVCHSV
jgi:hypothetical protein